MKLFSHIYLLLAILAGLLFPACGDGDFIDGPEGDLADCFNLNVSVPMVSSRAVADNLNEFTVNTLHLYFFRARAGCASLSPTTPCSREASSAPMHLHVLSMQSPTSTSLF